MKSYLKFITCGSVDDGKSTLIGHMLYDAKLIYADQKRSLELDSKAGSRDGELDYSLLLDGLMAEREQGITIDVAYRYFNTEERSFIVADTPGHEQYTRNMAVGASFADLAIILVDATQGVLSQTKRHVYICSMMGIKHFVLAVNKMDLVGYSEDRFEEIKHDFLRLMATHTVHSLQAMPVSATLGDNVTHKSLNMAWYKGDPLLTYLEKIDVSEDISLLGFVMPVQRVSRPNQRFRGFQGQIETGEITQGTLITVLPSQESAKVKEIYVGDKQVKKAFAGQPVTLTLDKEVDVSRGCVLCVNNDLIASDLITANLLWMDDNELVTGRNYLIQVGTKSLPAIVMAIKYKVDIHTGAHIATDKLLKNEIGIVEISVSEPLVFDVFSHRRALGALILVDRVSHMTSACGTIERSMRRSTDIAYQASDITRDIRALQKGQKPLTLWFTGLSGSGKSTLANEVEKRLVAMGKHTMLLDGDNVRRGLNKNLGFEEVDRVENIRRVAEVAKLMNEAGLIVLTSFISPYEEDRQNASTIIGDAYIEIYVNTSLEICEARDPKGLYKKARNGEISNFTGISSPYEVPLHPDLVSDSGTLSIEASTDQVMELILKKL
jgi:bifunctional enzyme CysN/CysC